MTELSTRDIRGLKGAPISILSLLLISPLPVDKIWLSRESGYSDKMVNQACAFLLERGYTEQNAAGCFISRNFVLDLPERDYEHKDCFKSGAQPPVKSLAAKARETKEQKAKWALLIEAGINRNDRTENMVNMKHVSLLYLQGKIYEYKAKNIKDTLFTAMLIRALERAEPAPPFSRNGHLKFCPCTKCEMDRGFGKI